MEPSQLTAIIAAFGVVFGGVGVKIWESLQNRQNKYERLNAKITSLKNLFYKWRDYAWELRGLLHKHGVDKEKIPPAPDEE